MCCGSLPFAPQHPALPRHNTLSPYLLAFYYDKRDRNIDISFNTFIKMKYQYCMYNKLYEYNKEYSYSNSISEILHLLLSCCY